MQFFRRVLGGCCLLAVLFGIMLIMIMPDFFKLLAEIVLELDP
jgi:hypothetical protein